MAKLGLTGGGMTSRMSRAERNRGGRSRSEEEKKKKNLPWKVIARDALELIAARRGRLTLGLGLMLVSRLAGMVLPGTTKILLDDVIGKGRRELLLPLVAAAGAATLIQAVTGFALSQVLGKAAQRSITEMRRGVRASVGGLKGGFFGQTVDGGGVWRVMSVGGEG